MLFINLSTYFILYLIHFISYPFMHNSNPTLIPL